MLGGNSNQIATPTLMVKAHSNTNDVKPYSGNTDHYFSVGHWQAVNTYEGTADIHALVLGGQPSHLSRSQSLLTYVRPRADGTAGVQVKMDENERKLHKLEG